MIKNNFFHFFSFIENISPHVYFLLITTWYIVYVVSIVGLAYIDPKYTKWLNVIIQYFIAVILFIRFNPFRKHISCNKNDRIFILASSFFLLVNDEFTNYVRSWFQKTVSMFDNVKILDKTKITFNN